MMQPRELAQYIDHSLLHPEVTVRELREFCRTAVQLGVFSVAVNSVWVEEAVRCLAGTDVRVGSSVGFPLGQVPAKLKELEARMAGEAGCHEVDMVLNIGALKSGEDNLVLDEIQAVVEAVKGRTVKIILETGLLTDEQKIRGTQLAIEAGAHFVKTSTGFNSIPGATIPDIKLLKAAAAGRAKVKASGGMVNLSIVLAMIEAGADRIGTKFTVEILRELAQNRDLKNHSQ